ncbi:hypothetical protein, partial [Streptomyces sp. NPDC059262]|uniref:hypothetical protein n=1 Tax=Streptomyces sp. NPDC059262 TaxID=3346797 RepID=UPI00367F5A85
LSMNMPTRCPARRSVPRSSDHEPRKIGLNALSDLENVVTEIAALEQRLETLRQDRKLLAEMQQATPARTSGS